VSTELGEQIDEAAVDAVRRLPVDNPFNNVYEISP
jgi:hypothetical protein